MKFNLKKIKFNLCQTVNECSYCTTHCVYTTTVRKLGCLAFVQPNSKLPQNYNWYNRPCGR